jgi:hypothetical protein
MGYHALLLPDKCYKIKRYNIESGSIVVYHWSKVNEWSADSFVKAKACRLLEYVKKEVVLN